MKKINFRKLILVIGIGIIALVSLVFKWDILKVNKNTNESEIKTEEKKPVESFEYKGRGGVDALTLLKEKTKVELDKSGMVVLIGERKADVEKREFWGFYVNGQMAQVGAADYKTKDTDVINWKIEKF